MCEIKEKVKDAVQEVYAGYVVERKASNNWTNVSKRIATDRAYDIVIRNVWIGRCLVKENRMRRFIKEAVEEAKRMSKKSKKPIKRRSVIEMEI